MCERDVNAFVMEPLMDAWMSEMEMGEYSLMPKKQVYRLLGHGSTLPNRIAKGAGRDLMRALAYDIKNVKLARDASDPA